MKSYKISFVVEADFRNLEIEAKNEEEAKEKLLLMDFEELVENASCKDFEIEDVDIEIEEEDFVVEIDDIEWKKDDMEKNENLPISVKMPLHWNRGDLVEDLIDEEMIYQFDCKPISYTYTFKKIEDDE